MCDTSSCFDFVKREASHPKNGSSSCSVRQRPWQKKPQTVFQFIRKDQVRPAKATGVSFSILQAEGRQTGSSKSTTSLQTSKKKMPFKTARRIRRLCSARKTENCVPTVGAITIKLIQTMDFTGGMRGIRGSTDKSRVFDGRTRPEEGHFTWKNRKIERKDSNTWSTASYRLKKRKIVCLDVSSHLLSSKSRKKKNGVTRHCTVFLHPYQSDV